MPFFAPPPAVAPVLQVLPALRFNGFRAGMPAADAAGRINAAAGTLICRPTTDWRMRDCTGRISPPNRPPPFEVLISLVNDSAAVIVLSTESTESIASSWVSALTENYGRPNQDGGSGRSSWQWIRAGTMLRVVERKSGRRWETSVTLTHGPLLDGLGTTQEHRPN